MYLNKWLIIILIFIGVYFPNKQQPLAKEILIFAASSLALPLKTIAHTYHEKSSNRVQISLAASSTLARQIYKGAPADIYISANKKWMDFLVLKNMLRVHSKREILSNRLVIISKNKQKKINSNLSVRSLNSLLKDRRLAIGNPLHVPVGIYAKQALVNLKIWPSIKDQLAFLPNSRAVLALVQRGEIPAGIVYQSDAHLNKKVSIYSMFPTNSHDRISYWAARTQYTNIPASQEFFRILYNKASKDIFKSYGFLVN